MNRRQFALSAAATAIAASWSRAVVAQPVDGPVQIVVPFTPAGVTDTLARVVGEALGKLWAQTVVIENRPGASGYIGAELVAKAPPDGRTLLVGTSALLTINPHVIRSAFDPARELVPVTTLGTSDVVVLMNPAVPVRSLRELADYAKTRPDGVSYGSPSNASTHHLTGELLQKHLGVKLVHVPYKGSAPGLNDVVAGHIPMMIDNIISALPFVHSGRLRAVAVSGGSRSPSLPEVPTFHESGLQGLQTSTWFPLLAPKGTPTELVERIQKDVAQVLSQAAIRERLLARGIDPSGESVAALQSRIERDFAQWKRVVADSKVTL